MGRTNGTVQEVGLVEPHHRSSRVDLMYANPNLLISSMEMNLKSMLLPLIMS